MNSEEIIDKAYELVNPIGQKYDPYQTIYYIIIKEEEDDCGEETGSGESFCKVCIDKAIADYKELYVDEVKGKLVDYICYDATGSERDGFSLCDSCGEHLDTCLLLDDQELDHWEEEDTHIDISDPRECFELSKIFNNSWNYGRQSENRIKAKEVRVFNLANKVIELFNNKI